jgi:hypothetical protein
MAQEIIATTRGDADMADKTKNSQTATLDGTQPNPGTLCKDVTPFQSLSAVR